MSITQHPVEDLYTAMAAKTWAALGNAALGSALRKYALPPVAVSSAGASPVGDLAVAIVPAGGAAPRSSFRATANEWTPRVNVTVRGAPRSMKLPYDLALEIQQWAQNLTLSGYLRVTAEASNPINLDPDGGDRSQWEVPVRLWFYA